MVGEMSAEAKKLIELTSRSDQFSGPSLDPSVDVGTVLEAHPELLKGMQEYMQWRDTANQQIAETKESTPVGHEMSRVLSQVPKKKKKGK